jgi:hypothetical protein
MEPPPQEHDKVYALRFIASVVSGSCPSRREDDPQTAGDPRTTPLERAEPVRGRIGIAEISML